MKRLDFDYVIVGGGSSGCVLAARLSAESGGTVALLERGRWDVNRWIHIPATFFKALEGQDAEAVISEPDSSLGGLRFPVPQGKVLGGGLAALLQEERIVRRPDKRELPESAFEFYRDLAIRQRHRGLTYFERHLCWGGRGIDQALG